MSTQPTLLNTRVRQRSRERRHRRQRSHSQVTATELVERNTSTIPLERHPRRRRQTRNLSIDINIEAVRSRFFRCLYHSAHVPFALIKLQQARPSLTKPQRTLPHSAPPDSSVSAMADHSFNIDPHQPHQDPSLTANEPWQSDFDPPPPPQPPRPEEAVHVPPQLQHVDPTATAPLSNEPPPPPLPHRPGNPDLGAPSAPAAQFPPAYNPSDYTGQPSHQSGQQFQPPPQRLKQTFAADDDPSSPVHYIRDPHKLIGYLVPFPKPKLPNVQPEDVPSRFMIYTPPPPPLQKPAEGAKEAKLHKVQRKWQEEVRSAKSSTAKTASWKGVKSKATRGISWAMNKTTTSNLDFLGRVSPTHSDDEHEGHETHETHKTIGVEEMILVYPPAMQLNDQQMREEFVNTMLRTKTKAQRDTIIATGLMPVTYGIDILATLIWPFGGLGEIDTVWAYSSFRGAKTARSVTKRLSSSDDAADDNAQLKLTFAHSQRIDVLKRYLDAECHKVDSKLFPGYATSPTESDVLEAIGWTPSDRRRPGDVQHEDRNWEDEQWELNDVKDDLRSVFSKAAKEWRKWCLLLEKNPEKAMKK